MIARNARNAFNEALLNPRIFGSIGTIGPVTDFTPQGRRNGPCPHDSVGPHQLVVDTARKTKLSFAPQVHTIALWMRTQSLRVAIQVPLNVLFLMLTTKRGPESAAAPLTQSTPRKRMYSVKASNGGNPVMYSRVLRKE